VSAHLDVDQPRHATVRGAALGYLLYVAAPAALIVFALVRWGSSSGAANHPLSTVVDKGYVLAVAVTVVVVTAHLFGALFKRLGQPWVLGEMIAGVLLGPSFLGAVAPDLAHRLFPETVVPFLQGIAHLGVVFFMFLVGLELQLKTLRGAGAALAVVGHSTIAVPFVGGVALALLLREGYQPATTSPMVFVLFVGLALGVTAFPVLARILDDCRMRDTRIGNIGLATAAICDVTAWCLLAAVIAMSRAGSGSGTVMVIALTVIFAAVMLLVVRPALGWAMRRMAARGTDAQVAMALLTCLVLLCGLITDGIGIHAIFGAFLAGLIMPRSAKPVQVFASKVEGLTLWLLLPVFFATVGLKLSLGPSIMAGGLATFALIVAVAVGGKVLGTAGPARMAGLTWRESTQLSIMMNCRGLTELVVLNLGLSLAIIETRLYGLLVMLTLLSTLATAPLLRATSAKVPIAAKAPVNVAKAPVAAN